jgi:formylglycine-generating enzyme required for sulfatase activity
VGDFHLLVIGVDEYLHWPRLKSAVRDAQAVTRMLQEEYSFEPKRVIGLYNAEATLRRIEGALRKLAQELKEDDSLIVFYAGHGHCDELTGMGSWIPVEADRDATTWLDNARIKALLRAAKARHILLVSDSCFAGDFFQQPREGLPAITDDYVRRAFGKVSRQVITSGALEPVVDEGIGGHSWFTHYLLRELRENPTPYLLPSDLWNRIKGGVAANAKQQPLFGILEGTGGEIGGEFVLFRKGVGGSIDDLLAKKREQMTALGKMEAEAQEANEREQTLQRQKEAELRKLDEQIAEMQARLQAGSTVTGDDLLDELARLADEKERQAQELERLRQQAADEKRKREAEIEVLRKQELARKKAAFEEDYAKYRKIMASPHLSLETKQQAWNTICLKWGVELTDKKSSELTWCEDGVRLASVKVQDLPGGMRLELCRISPGEFLMGRNGLFVGDEKPQHRVRITKGFWMGRYPVTQAQYKAVMGTNPSHFKGEQNPVETVSWDDAVAFCQKIGARLPTEAEWEYACRAERVTKYSSGDSERDLDCVGWYCNNSENKTHPVGQKQPNAWELYDMCGNVWEWCADWYGSYPDGDVSDPTGPGPSYNPGRILRGGSWGSKPDFCRSAGRGWNVPGIRDYRVGFRVCMDFE